MSAHAALRGRTAAAHARVDEVFGRFDLARQESYIRFLQAHAKALPPIEAVLGHERLPRWRPRTGCLSRDLAAFGHGLPALFPSTRSRGLAQQVGLLYVVEGSRLGGRLLLQSVDPGFSSHYLSAIHEPGEWRAFTKCLNDLANSESVDWLEDAVGGAIEAFQLYEAAAEAVFIT